MKENTFYSVYKIPANTYSNQKEEVLTVTVKATLIVSADASEDDVYNLTKAIFDIANIKCEVKPIHSHEFKTPVKRPFYSVLDKTKIKETYNIKIPYWRDSLRFCINNIINL